MQVQAVMEGSPAEAAPATEHTTDATTAGRLHPRRQPRPAPAREPGRYLHAATGSQRLGNHTGAAHNAMLAELNNRHETQVRERLKQTRTRHVTVTDGGTAGHHGGPG